MNRLLKNILVVRETKAAETRVALIPSDAKDLINNGFKVTIESGAGDSAGFCDDSYMQQGCYIRKLENNDIAGFNKLFDGIDLILRAKRPERRREMLENQVLKSGTIMIGALDIFERNSPHIEEYKNKSIEFYSIDQFSEQDGLSKHILGEMSKLAGKLALEDAIHKFVGQAKKAAIIGLGRAGIAAYEAAIDNGLEVILIGGRRQLDKTQATSHVKTVFLDKNSPISIQQEIIRNEVIDVDIIIASARNSNATAPMLIPEKTLREMKQGCVIIDLALSEGGNVFGSEHDSTVILGNSIIIANVSGYPKALENNNLSLLW